MRYVAITRRVRATAFFAVACLIRPTPFRQRTFNKSSRSLLICRHRLQKVIIIFLLREPLVIPLYQVAFRIIEVEPSSVHSILRRQYVDPERADATCLCPLLAVDAESMISSDSILEVLSTRHRILPADIPEHRLKPSVILRLRHHTLDAPQHEHVTSLHRIHRLVAHAGLHDLLARRDQS